MCFAYKNSYYSYCVWRSPLLHFRRHGLHFQWQRRIRSGQSWLAEGQAGCSRKIWTGKTKHIRGWIHQTIFAKQKVAIAQKIRWSIAPTIKTSNSKLKHCLQFAQFGCQKSKLLVYLESKQKSHISIMSIVIRASFMRPFLLR